MNKLLLLALILSATCAHAGEVSVHLDSKSIRQSGSVAYDQPVVVTSVVETIGTSGWYVGGFWSSGLDTRLNQDGGDEMGIFLGSVRRFGKLKTDTGITYFNLVPLNELWGTGDELRLHGDIQYSLREDKSISLKLFARLEFKEVSGLPSGFYTHAGIRGHVTITPKLTFQGEGALLHNTGVYGSDAALSAYGDLSLRWKVNDSLSLSVPRVRLTTPLTVDDKDSQWMIGVGMHLQF